MANFNTHGRLASLFNTSLITMPSFSTTPISTPRKATRRSYAHFSVEDLMMEVSHRVIFVPERVFISAMAKSPPSLSSYDRKRVIEDLKRDDYFTHPYLQWSNKDLCKFIKERKLTFPVKRNKHSMISVLEEADFNFTFPIMDLPPELRCKIYEYTMAHEERCPIKLPKKYMPRPERYPTARLASHKQHKKPVPALARVSRLIRHESMYTFEQIQKGLKDRREEAMRST